MNITQKKVENMNSNLVQMGQLQGPEWGEYKEATETTKGCCQAPEIFSSP